MNKKTYFVLGGLVLVVIAGTVIGLFRTKNQVAPTTLSQVKAKSATNVAKCTAEKDDSTVKADPQEQTYITNAAIANITDVPAGTNVDVYIKTYDGGKATGTSVYAGKYGSYNFTAEKSGSATNNTYQGNWTITSFAACKL